MTRMAAIGAPSVEINRARELPGPRQETFNAINFSNVVMRATQLTRTHSRLEGWPQQTGGPSSIRAMDAPCLQEQYAPHNTCFGCGPANEGGLRIRSFLDGDDVIAEWTPIELYEAFPGMLNGGIVGTLLDCHCNWTAAAHLMQSRNTDSPPCTVTADYAIKLRRPTPSNQLLRMRARVVESEGDRAIVEATLESGGKQCATCRGTFVAVKPGHPAYHRW